MTPPRAVVFDFNGTLSDDEQILCEIFRELFAEHGRPLSVQEYFDELCGLSDPEIVRTWLGYDDPALVEERVARYRAAVAGGSTIGDHVRAAVRYAAGRAPVAVVSGAARSEIEPVLAAAGLAPVVRVIVSSDDVSHGKPHPEGYLRALELLDGGLGWLEQPDRLDRSVPTDARAEPARPDGRRRKRRLRADELLAFEDTEAGVAAAKAAGLRCLAVKGTLAPERLAAADELVDRIDVELMRRLLDPA